jgi:hypothetical protein
MTTASTLALLAAACLAWSARRTVRRARAVVDDADALVRQCGVVLLSAERAWGERHRTSVAWQDERGEAVAASTLCDLVRARANLEGHHGV